MTSTTDLVGTPGSSAVNAAAAAPAKSLPSRVIGVLLAPRATYASVAARPRWFGVLAFIVLLGAAGTYIFLSTEVGRNAMVDQQIETMRSFGVQLNDAAI